MDVKKQCAEEALTYIENGMTVGLGGGSTIKHLVTFLKDSGRSVKVVTPSWETKQHCVSEGLQVLPLSDVPSIDIAFDGCDQVDQQLDALKSGGGIHTEEKLVAYMADEYVLLVDESKFVPALTFEHPVVVEVLPQALPYVRRKLESFPVLQANIRMSADKDGAVITENGNLLLDVYVDPDKADSGLEGRLKGLTGVIDTSLFTSVVTKALVAGPSGIREITIKGEN
ncbi:UNVERIFIED_CONTAM: ribose 5-phosphate isomerase A [Halobacillus marinus]